MIPEETPLLDAESMQVLVVAYRARPGTVSELADLLEPALVTRLDPTLDALERAGFLERIDDRLELESPYMAFIAISRARMERLQTETARTVTLMESLPHLIRNWDLGEAKPGEDHPLVATIVHGREERWALWRRHLLDQKPSRPSWVLPDTSMLKDLLTDGANALAATLQGGAVRPRILVRPGSHDEHADQELLLSAPGLGIDVRVLDRLPSWFYVDEDKLAGLPVTWGEAWPSSILLVRTPPMIGALNLIFDGLWNRAEPVSKEPRGWEPVVRLLAQGLTDEAVARFLGLDVRTVRRRVAEAMSDLGATSRFALGMAWAARN